MGQVTVIFFSQVGIWIVNYDLLDDQRCGVEREATLSTFLNDHMKPLIDKRSPFGATFIILISQLSL